MNKWKFIDFLREGTPESFARLSSALFIVAAILIALAEVSFALWQFAWNNFAIYEVHTGLILELGGVGMLGKATGKYFENKNK